MREKSEGIKASSTFRTKLSYVLILGAFACSGESPGRGGPTEPPTPGTQKLVFSQHPTSSFVGSEIQPVVQVRLEDASGRPVTTSGLAVTVTLTGAPPGVALSGSTTATTLNGVATFSQLAVSGPADNLRLTASAAGIEAVASEEFRSVRPAFVIDSTKLSLVSDSAARSRGTYAFQLVAGALPAIDSGMVIVGSQGGGFIRRVKHYAQAGQIVTLSTDSAALSDVVRDGDFSVDVPLALPVSETAGSISNVQWAPARVRLQQAGVLIRNGEIVLDGLQLFGTSSDGLWVKRGRIRFSPAVNLAASFGAFSLKSAKVTVSGKVEFDAELELGLRAEVHQKSQLPLFTLSRDFVGVVGGVPVYGRVEVPFILTFETGAGADTGILFRFTSEATVTGGAEFSSGTWTPLNSAGATFNPSAPATRGNIDVFAKLGAMAKARVSVYGTAGADIWVEPFLRADLDADLLNNVYTTSCSSAVDIGFGIDLAILGHEVARFERTGTLGQNNWTACQRTWSAVRYSSVVVGQDHACGLTTTNTAYCWGTNGYGILGNPTEAVSRSSTPLAVQGGHRFNALSAGGVHTCGLTPEGDVLCWGNNYQGQLGIGTAAWGSYSAVPVRALLPEPAQAVDGGAEITCALGRSGQAYCWGRNSYGVLGRAQTDTTTRPTPAPVSGGLSFVSISAGGYHVCGLTSSGTTHCWGNNSSGQLGGQSSTQCTFPPEPYQYPCSATPIKVTGNLTFTRVESGFHYSCGMLASGAEYCWGGGGNLGIAGVPSSPSPVRTQLPEPASGISAGNGHACAVGISTVGYCWGGNFFGQLGSGEHEACAFSGLACKELPYPVVDRRFKSIVAGGHASCGIATDNRVYCWGWNYFGQLGNGAALGGPSMTDYSTRPLLVVGQIP